MNITLTPTLTTVQKRRAKVWLTAQLVNSELADPAVSMDWMNGAVTVYVNGQPKTLQTGNWCSQTLARRNRDGYCMLPCGNYNPQLPAPSKSERLAILGGIAVAVGLWDELAEEYSQALGRVVLDAYNSCCLDMVQAPKPAGKLAFSADKHQAAIMYTDEPDVWYLNSGEPVKIDDTWQQVAA